MSCDIILTQESSDEKSDMKLHWLDYSKILKNAPNASLQFSFEYIPFEFISISFWIIFFRK